MYDYEDDDATPKLPQPDTYGDILEDQTPILGNNPIFHSESTGHLDLNYLPQQNMSSKFKRLSTTLQTSNNNSSNDSQRFMNKFTNNVRTSYNEASAAHNRTSVYYNKINETLAISDNEYDGEDDMDDHRELVRENSVIRPDESDVSTISNRSSLISNENNDFSQTLPDNESVSQDSNNFYFNKQPPVPLKIIRNQSIAIYNDDVPVRGDLVKPYHSEEHLNSTPGLNITYTEEPKSSFTDDSKTVGTDTSQTKTDTDASAEDEDLSSLFVRALHPFDSSTLQSKADASICLPFEKDDMAVVHTIDESGWGEVTLIESLQRGWVPMNYFKFAIDDGNDDYDDSDDVDDEIDEGRIPNNHFLKPLFNACGRFLVNPLSHKTRKGKYTFSIRVVNSIRDGVRVLLQETDCLSRSNEIVTKRPIVRKARKILLADWYNLMKKANDFKGTSDYYKIEVLTLMVFQVVRRAIAFLQLWSIESKQIIKKESEKKLQNDMNSYKLLDTPPLAKQRVTEINGVLYSYLGMIVGRLDLIEHNSVGCDLLETLTHQIILLLRELLFISKTGSDFSSEKPADLDNSLDSLLSLVSDLVTAVKSLVVKTLNETIDDQRYHVESKKSNLSNTEYFYTHEGGELIQIASKMMRAIGGTVSSIRRLLEITGNFKLNAQRSYPDYAEMRIEPSEFIRRCSLGIAESNTIRNRQLRTMKPTARNASNRFSMMRFGKTGELGITPGGAGLLHDVLLTDIDGEFSKDKEFAKFTHTESTADDLKMENELLVDARGNLLGASFRGLVYTLTNENTPPEYFFVSTFFICFRSFASGPDLIEELISRFDMSNSYAKVPGDNNINLELKIKNRRRLISKMFQLWLESYWNHELDYSLLPTLINFFNEGISQFLPLDSMKLLEVASRLFSKPVTEDQKQAKKQRQGKQLVTRSITATRLNRKNSLTEATNDITARYSMVDGYELSKINTNSSTSTSLKSINLSLPLGIGNQTSSSSSLLTKANISTIEKLILTYRAIIGNGWCPNNYINPKIFIPMDIKTLIPNWYEACDQSWVLSNYRPNLLDFNGLELAKQLTLIESTIFCSIKPEELLNDNYTSKRAHLKLAPHVRQSILFTNCLSGYVIESVLQPKINHKMRLNIVKTWLKVAISCLYLRNFNSLAAIITSLQSHLITRISKLWSDLSDKYKELHEYLSGIIHPDKNYRVYRAKLRNFLVANEYNIPTVPYFSLFLQDLTFVTDGNPKFRQANDFLNKKLINIDKYLKTARIIADIESLQIGYDRPTPSGEGDDYTIIPVSCMQELILLEIWKVCQLNKKEEDRAWKLSCVIQPRENN
ncbi:ras GEF [Yamadazyma tenuis ATCC 10573]|uniref:Ras GEF n=1 Tax=Candida tenuis (strain ATCC 10573 / BCRC 21748 / CBS 615 / JCM 9827 / NBRC 10315 / NRRL Y-1498 / VKM Y-70) TaxID=590646 RepID=G3AZG9_CANTC|nr:ras GEF [Yamadazyma tenuis ATCC 10573]EGV66092.1 ras GEF [Yamadazyma tenuis ATCC 10573]